MGVSGFILPVAILVMMITSIKKGLGASGAQLQKDHAGDKFGEERV